MSLSEYPFTHQAAERVRDTGYSIENLLEKRGFQPVRNRALDRVLGAISGDITTEPGHPLAELLSYPLARVMVSCLGDELLVRRYSLAESKLARRKMNSEDLADLILLAQDLDVNPNKNADLLEIHFSEYLKSAHYMHSPKWKLVNRAMRNGWVTITAEELTRLLEERARSRIQEGLPLQVPPQICQRLGEYLSRIKRELEAVRPDQTIDLGEVNEEAFPPCIKLSLSQVTQGTNLSHTARFALTTFLLHVGMTVDEVVQIFNTSPDFDEEKTRYQVGHIAGRSGTSYKPPSCATMSTYGNCPGKEKLCKWVNHPLNYYRKAIRRKK